MFAWGEGKILRLMRGLDPPVTARTVESDMLVLKGAREHGRPGTGGLRDDRSDGAAGPRHGAHRRHGPADARSGGSRGRSGGWPGSVGGRTRGCTRSSRRTRSETTKRVHHPGSRQSPHVPEGCRRGRRSRCWRSLPDGDRLSHGDFHPANILMDGDEPVIIDWSNVTRGDPAADVARTLVILESGEPPPGTPLAAQG